MDEHPAILRTVQKAVGLYGGRLSKQGTENAQADRVCCGQEV
jgi:hypothetical protein